MSDVDETILASAHVTVAGGMFGPQDVRQLAMLLTLSWSDPEGAADVLRRARKERLSAKQTERLLERLPIEQPAARGAHRPALRVIRGGREPRPPDMLEPEHAQ